MSSRCRELFLCVALCVAARGDGRAASPEICGPGSEANRDATVLRVAADPNNLPFSNDRLEGFENKVMALIARDLGVTVEYTWRAQRRGFFRHTVKEGNCDVVPGVPRGFDRVLTTQPYYRSTYVFVSRRDRNLGLASLDDPRLRSLKIGVQMVGDDFMNTPPAHALTRRGLVENVRGYTLYGDYREENPPSRIVEAVVRGEIDVALVWGPLAGFFAKRHGDDLVLVPLPEEHGPGALPFGFDICVGVAKTNPELRARINAILTRRRAEIAAILDAYGVPQMGSPQKLARAR